MKKLFSVMLLISLSISFVSCKNQNDPQPQPLTKLSERVGRYDNNATGFFVIVEAEGYITFANAGLPKQFDPNSTETRFDYNNFDTYIVFIDNNSLNYFSSEKPFKCIK